MLKMATFYQMVLTGTPRPKVTWVFEEDGSIHLKTDQRPDQATLWQATNPNARDFRLLTIGKRYTSRLLEAEQEGYYVGRVEVPKRGWTAFFVELTFHTDNGFPLKLTTDVRVVPETLPFADRPIRRADR